MKAHGFKAKRPSNGDVALQITSMADIFIILLVFLLKSYSSGAMNITPSPGVQLPAALTDEQHIEALTLEISENAIQVDNQPVTPLDAYRLKPADLRPGGTPGSLDQALETQRKRRELIAQSNSDVRLDSKILVVSDRRTPYATLKSVLWSAAAHGFTDYKLVVLKRD